MRVKTAAVIPILLLVPCSLLGQQVDPSVQVPDLSVKARVQDVDHPDSALLPGGSVAWTGQPIMIQKSPDAAQKGSSLKSNPFPSLTSMSTWGGVSSTTSSNSSAGVVRPRSVLTSSKSALSRKLNTMLMTRLDLHPANTDLTVEELAAEENQLTRTSAALELHKLRQQTSRSRPARLRVANPLVAKADAATTGRWHADQFSANALEQQRHEGALLLRHGYTARKKGRRRHAKVHTPGVNDYAPASK